jgi:hypothetical protein
MQPDVRGIPSVEQGDRRRVVQREQERVLQQITRHGGVKKLIEVREVFVTKILEL